jgi:hypothetical protein
LALDSNGFEVRTEVLCGSGIVGVREVVGWLVGSGSAKESISVKRLDVKPVPLLLCR